MHVQVAAECLPAMISSLCQFICLRVFIVSGYLHIQMLGRDRYMFTKYEMGFFVLFTAIYEMGLFVLSTAIYEMGFSCIYACCFCILMQMTVKWTCLLIQKLGSTNVNTSNVSRHWSYAHLLRKLAYAQETGRQKTNVSSTSFVIEVLFDCCKCAISPSCFIFLIFKT